jgi:hypothetical protein
MAAERIDGPTPNGGEYAVAHFSRDGEAAEKADATAVEILEYSADGECIARTYGRLPGAAAEGIVP